MATGGESEPLLAHTEEEEEEEEEEEGKDGTFNFDPPSETRPLLKMRR